jgi:hypothetical protein
LGFINKIGDIMTRRDYVLLADAIRTARNKEGRDGRPLLDQWAVDVVSAHLADTLKADNPRFDRDRFLDAAGNEAWRPENGKALDALH